MPIEFFCYSVLLTWLTYGVSCSSAWSCMVNDKQFTTVQEVSAHSSMLSTANPVSCSNAAGSTANTCFAIYTTPGMMEILYACGSCDDFKNKNPNVQAQCFECSIPGPSGSQSCLPNLALPDLTKTPKYPYFNLIKGQASNSMVYCIGQSSTCSQLEYKDGNNQLMVWAGCEADCSKVQQLFLGKGFKIMLSSCPLGTNNGAQGGSGSPANGTRGGSGSPQADAPKGGRKVAPISAVVYASAIASLAYFTIK